MTPNQYAEAQQIAHVVSTMPAALQLARSDRGIALFINNPATSFWLRDALKAALNRDALDALADARTLAALLEARVAALTAGL
jgi:hypothetical protein